MPSRRAARGIFTLGLLLMPPAPASTPSPALSEALRQAAAEEGFVLLVFASPLVPVSEAPAAALPAKMREGLSAPVAVLRLDPYDGADGTEQAHLLNLSSLPAMVLVDARGVEVERVAHLPRDPRKLLGDLVSGKGPLARARLALREHPGDPEAALALGRELLSRGDLEGARPLLEQVARAADPALSTRARFDVALLELRRGEAEAARTALARIVAESHGDAAATEAELALAQLLLVQGDVPEAARALERFRMDHQGHPRDAEAAALLARIREAPADPPAVAATPVPQGSGR